ncbi:DUF3159 domain-containing protein [Streptomyces niveus]|uniref:DUF3159 domain-containing protein n=1 Tax=Streptomyces niveus TaxID=193462 RepID=UPI0033EFE35A
MGLPVVAFVVANSAFGLAVAIGTAVGVAAAIAVLRLVRKEPVRPALSKRLKALSEQRHAA